MREFFKYQGHAMDEVFQPGGDISIMSSKVIIVMRVGDKCIVISIQIICIEFLKRIKFTQIIPAFMQDPCCKHACGTPIAVIERMDRYKLVMCNPGNNWRCIICLSGVDPIYKFAHQSRHIMCFGGHVNNRTFAITDHILSVAVRAGFRTPA